MKALSIYFEIYVKLKKKFVRHNKAFDEGREKIKIIAIVIFISCTRMKTNSAQERKNGTLVGFLSFTFIKLI